MKQDSKYFDMSAIDFNKTFNFILSPRLSGKQYVIARRTKIMDKGTMLTIADYCFEKAKAAKEKQDELFKLLQLDEFKTVTDKIETSGEFYKESGRFNAFIELYNKLKEF